MSCPLFWVMFVAWALMAWNFYRAWKLNQKLQKDADQWAHLCSELILAYAQKKREQ